MTRPRHMRVTDERGFTLIELLVVALIIGILAAIAIPSFLSQKTKASDAPAKELVRAAQTATETYAIDHGGSYGGLEPSKLNEIDSAIVTVATTGNAYLTTASPAESNNGYSVTAKAITGNTFTITKKQNGGVERSCATAGKGSCSAAGTW